MYFAHDDWHVIQKYIAPSCREPSFRTASNTNMESPYVIHTGTECLPADDDVHAMLRSRGVYPPRGHGASPQDGRMGPPIFDYNAP